MKLPLWWGVTRLGERFFMRAAPACCALLVAVRLPLHSQGTPEWLELGAEFSIGREEPGYDLTMVGDVVTVPGGMILVAQPREGLVRVFGSTGSLIGSVGRRGSGPGEFQRVSGLTVRGDTLMVSDGSLSRVSVFLPRWTLIQTISISPALAGRSYRRLAPLGVLRDGSIVASPVVAATVANNPEATVLPLYVVGRDNEIKGILAELDMSDVSARISTGVRFIAISRPLSNASLWDVAADGSVVDMVHPRVPTGSRRERFQVIALRSAAVRRGWRGCGGPMGPVASALRP
ncbi:MAG: hypothetical protein KatS3mg081_0313 [Gemmatimonadales bacterium]|nr:MAG: hypothetical protein KatS3mg081_0313 [Gemmatimonadales bacterium]